MKMVSTLKKKSYDVPITKLHSAFQKANESVYHKSTLRPILCHYGYERKKKRRSDDEQSDDDDVVPTTSHKHKGPALGEDEYFFKPTDPAEELELLMRRDAHLLKQLSEQERKRYFSHVDFKERMEEKVEQQRKAAQQRKKLEEEKKNQKKEHQLVKRLERIELSHDQKFVETVPKSEFYKIYKKQAELKRKGQLKWQTELEEFWSRELRNSGLLRNPLHHRDPRAPYLVGSFLTQKAGEPTALDRELTRITEMSDRATATATAPVTLQLGRSKKQEDMDRKLERLFPKSECPRLRCFEMDLTEEKMDEVETKRRKGLAKRDKLRKEKKGEYQKMYQMAITHGTVAQRIFDERFDTEEDCLMHKEPTNLSDLRKDKRKAKPTQTDSSQIQHIIEDEGDVLEEDVRLPVLQRGFLGFEPISEENTLRSEQKEHTAVEMNVPPTSRQTMRPSPPPPMILTMDDLSKECTIIEAKKPSSLWTNYTGAGNVRFAPIEDEWLLKRMKKEYQPQ